MSKGERFEHARRSVMRLPGFTAEATLASTANPFSMYGLYANRSAADIITTAVQCCPPGSDTTGCTRPNCLTTGCPPGLVCCDCLFPPRCRTQSDCINIDCRL